MLVPTARRLLDRVRYAPFLVQLVITRRCNLTCGYCNEYDRTSEPVPLETLVGRLRKLRELGTLQVELTGGEPLLHPDIYELVRLVRRLGMRAAMISNAFLLNEDKVARLNRAGLQDLQISVDGVKPNDVTVKVLDALRGKLAHLEHRARFRVVLSGVIGAAPPGEVLEVVRFARRHGFTPRVLLLHGSDGQLKLSAEELEAFREVKRILGARFTDAQDYRTRLIERGEAAFRCRSGSRYLYVDHLGVVRWCSQTADAFGVPLERYDTAELARQFRTRKPCNPACTVGCARSCSKVDFWRPQDLDPAPPA